MDPNLDPTVVVAALTSFSLICVALLTAFSKKWKTPETEIARLKVIEEAKVAEGKVAAEAKAAEDAVEAKRIADERLTNANLLSRFEFLLEQSEAYNENKIRDLSSTVQELKTEVAEMKNERDTLVNFIYHLIRIIRKHGHVEEIKEPPHGIYVH